MQIVIDIPDDRYEELMTDDIYLDVPIFKEDIIATIPKGHGRLIDADELFWDIQTDEQMRLGEHLAWVKERIDEAPTIIEAESEETTE